MFMCSCLFLVSFSVAMYSASFFSFFLLCSVSLMFLLRVRVVFPPGTHFFFHFFFCYCAKASFPFISLLRLSLFPPWPLVARLLFPKALPLLSNNPRFFRSAWTFPLFLFSFFAPPPPPLLHAAPAAGCF